jgi:hypothetical protein
MADAPDSKSSPRKRGRGFKSDRCDSGVKTVRSAIRRIDGPRGIGQRECAVLTVNPPSEGGSRGVDRVAVDVRIGDSRPAGGRTHATPGRRPFRPLWESFCSRGNWPKYLADGFEVRDIPFLGATCDLVEPSHRGRLQTWFGWISGGINHVDEISDDPFRNGHTA